MKEASHHSTEEVLLKERTDEVYSFDASFAQKRLWLIDQLLEDKFVYNIPTTIRLQGIIQIEALKRAFSQIVNRHDTLRTTFREVDGEIVQIVRERLEWEIQIDDLSSLEGNVCWEHAINLAEKEAETAFDLQQGPLFHIRLIRLNEKDHLLLINLHHIISDGWSTDILKRELSQLYKAFIHQEKIELEEMPIQYADYAHYQKEQLHGEEYESQLQFWKNKLSGELPVLQLSSATPQSSKRGNRGETFEFTVNPIVSHAIKQFSQREKTTNFMTLFAAYNVWLYRYANQTDLIVGIPVAGREWEEVEGLIGFFINNLVIRSQIDENVSFHSFLQNVKKNIIEAYSNQDVPFEKVVEIVQPDRDIHMSPIFQNMFSLRFTDTTFAMEGLQAEVIDVDRHSAKFDLLMEMAESEDGFTGTLEYSTDLFDRETIKKMVNHFLNILEGITKNADKSVARLPMLTEEEVHQQVHLWNQTDLDYPFTSVQEGFEVWASRKPKEIAIVFGEETVSYRELNRKANQLAHKLQSLGVGLDTLVGICLESTPDMVISMLAVQKAGGAYVPLDPSLPVERRRYMVERAGLKVLVTKQVWAEKLPVGAEVTVVCLDSEARLLAAESEDNLQSKADAMNRMYVIFTSGSTGEPKGVNVFRRGFENLMQWYIGEFQMTDSDSMLLTTSPSFDMTQKSIYAPLMTGGQLVLYNSGLYDAAAITNEIEKNNITLLSCTPSAFYPLLDEAVRNNYSELRKLRHVFLGGEPIVANRLSSWTSSSACNAEVVNTYGPTECTDITVFKRLPDMELLLDKPMPIGRPVPNNKTYILNSELGLVPVGTPGELCIAGVQVGGGYIGDNTISAEKFLVNPYGDDQTPLLYRTGDIARYLQDGTIEYLGRIDHQVKIRGFRIELGEIEVALRKCDGVKESVVVATENQHGEKRLVAYIVPKEKMLSEDELSTRLRNDLLGKLPNYMVPSLFIFLDEMPLSPNGKIERKALPVPKILNGQGRLYTAPRTALEMKMADIWMSLLDVERIGVYDNFFEYGGHSLLATQLVSRLRSVLDTNITLRALFDNPTIAELASDVFSNKPEVSKLESELNHRKEDILQMSREGKIPLSFSQKRLWFLDRLEPESIAYNLFSAFRIEGTVDKQALEICLNQIVERHESLRTTFKDEDDPVQIISPTLHIPITLKDFRETEEEKKSLEVERFILKETSRSFDLERGPLLNVSLLWLGEGDYILLVSMHHIISDGWSIGLLIQELGELYSAYLRGKPATLPELSVQYADYAKWQNIEGSRDIFKHLTAYWSKQLGGELPILELPSDNPRPNRQAFRGGRTTVQIQKDTIKKLKELSRKREVTDFMVFLSAFSVLLNRLSKQEDMIIGTPIAGRTQTETEPLIGCFINTLALRIDLSEKPTFEEVLKRVRKVCLDAYAHQEMPFEKLVEIIQPERSLSRNPIIDVMINLVNIPNKTAQWQDVTLSQMDVGDPQSKFGLTLYIHETRDGIEMEFVYQKDLYSEERIKELSNQYTSLLKQMVDFSELPICSYSLKTDKSIEILPNPKAKLEKPLYPSVPEMFSRVALENPNQIAISHQGNKKNYGELAEAAQSVALSLHAGGLNKGEVVAISGPRSMGLIASMLGVLFAGGTVLTIEKNMQLERRQTILLSSSVNRLIYVGSKSQAEDESFFTNYEWKEVYYIDSMNGNLLTNSIDSKSIEIASFTLPQPEDPAYIFFTSGTTGMPKGVIGKHSGLGHFLVWQREKFGIGPGDRAAQLTGLSFDVVLRDILLPLTSGATICLPDVEEDLSALQVLPWLKREKVTYFHTVPSLAKSWLEIENIKLNHLRYVFFAGEPLTADLVHSWRTNFGEHTKIINLYGPTETTLAKCYFEVPNTDELSSVQPIGQPLPETQILVLNTELQLCGIGEPGEMFIRTPFRTLGYLQSDEKDSALFIPNPFTDDPKDILYRTGDMGIYRTDGLLDIKGRLDDQIKIRGIRVELGEIQSIISSHPLVKESVVITVLATNGDKRIAAYFVPHDDLVEIAELRAYVKEKIPSFMVPGAFIKIKAIPLNANGKVDRRNLPDPTISFNERVSVLSISPKTEIEEKIGEVWKELLGVKHVGIHDNFFDIGGHSLLILQAKTKLAKLLRRDIPLVDFFQYPTISSLATQLTKEGEESLRFEKFKSRGSNRRNALQKRRNKRNTKK
ncbi:amino acid adenylation domain-containing protein [Bacillus sp. 2205SS5-2]|uniref:amino acid adenylation domain-containing protein n=1 Tax=Bacillus sp. 2205SS5-2 TaxID=3109031 RepID=UPI003005BF51